MFRKLLLLVIVICGSEIVTASCDFSSANGAEQAERPTSESITKIAFVVVDTGQDECYDNDQEIICPRTGEAFYGQDAQYNGPQPSYQDNGDGTITDLNTGLIWQQTSPLDRYTWDEASLYAENLELAGYTDWRVPTIKELYSLAAFNGNINILTPYIDTHYFDFEYPDTIQGYRIIDAQYWSSNKYVGTTMYGDVSAFGFNFADGRIKAYPIGEGGGPTAENYIRCVRSGDGYGENIYVDNGDGTITDLATGLMWMKADSGTTMNWEQALSYAESLEYAGYDDWRLPNAKELQSIVDYTRAPDALDLEYQNAAIDPIFDLTEIESWFWTSTTHNDNGFGIYLCFGRALAYNPSSGEFIINAHGAGAQRSDPKNGHPADYPNGLGPQVDEIRIYNYVRCVRGGGEGVEIVTASDNDNDSDVAAGVNSLFRLSPSTSYFTYVDGQIIVYSPKSSAISDYKMYLLDSGGMLSDRFDESEGFRASDAGERFKIFPLKEDDLRLSFDYAGPTYHFDSEEEQQARGNIFSIAW